MDEQALLNNFLVKILSFFTHYSQRTGYGQSRGFTTWKTNIPDALFYSDRKHLSAAHLSSRQQTPRSSQRYPPSSHLNPPNLLACPSDSSQSEGPSATHLQCHKICVHTQACNTGRRLHST